MRYCVGLVVPESLELAPGCARGASVSVWLPGGCEEGRPPREPRHTRKEPQVVPVDTPQEMGWSEGGNP